MSEEISSTAGATCVQHPGVAAPFVCTRCQSPVCGDCCYSMPDGSICCKTCYHQQSTPAPQPAVEATPAVRTTGLRINRTPAAQETARAPASQAYTPTYAGAGGLRCVQHPHLAAVARCKICGAGSCHTCDFLFPPNHHYCPQCISSSGGKMSSRRKKYMIWSFVMPAVAIVGFVLSIIAGSMLDNELSDTAAGILIIFLSGLPSVVGLGLAMSAWRSGGPNPVGVWIALIWNSLQALGFLGLMIIGTFMA